MKASQSPGSGLQFLEAASKVTNDLETSRFSLLTCINAHNPRVEDEIEVKAEQHSGLTEMQLNRTIQSVVGRTKGRVQKYLCNLVDFSIKV